MTQLYRWFASAPVPRQIFADALRLIASPDALPLLFHCTAGKDRTGWTAAVLLPLLGVDRATVTGDYLLSNRYRDARADDPLNGVQRSWLDAAFDQVDRTYGSFSAYVRDGLRLDDREIAALRARLLG